MLHITTTHQLTIRAPQATKLGFLSLTPPPPRLPYPSRLSVSASPPPIGSHQNVPTIVHSAPIEAPHLQQINTQALGKNHNLSSTVCQHTPTPVFPQSQLLPLPSSPLPLPPILQELADS